MAPTRWQHSISSRLRCMWYGVCFFFSPPFSFYPDYTWLIEQHQSMTFRFLAIVPPFSLRSMNPGPHTPIYARGYNQTQIPSLALSVLTKGPRTLQPAETNRGNTEASVTEQRRQQRRPVVHAAKTPQYFVYKHKCVCTVRRESACNSALRTDAEICTVRRVAWND